jgi:hypothetical protein
MSLIMPRERNLGGSIKCPIDILGESREDSWKIGAQEAGVDLLYDVDILLICHGAED